MIKDAAKIIILSAIWLSACSTGRGQLKIEETGLSSSNVVESETPAAAGITEVVADGGGNADVTHVRAVLEENSSWTFHVTITHPDTGWDDYADGWNLVTPDGKVLKTNPDDRFTRLLAHPHVSEQPFTRSQDGIRMPDGMTRIIVRAHDIKDGFGGMEVLVDLETITGPGYEVVRK